MRANFATFLTFGSHFCQQRVLRGQKFLYFSIFQTILKISIFVYPLPTDVSTLDPGKPWSKGSFFEIETIVISPEVPQNGCQRSKMAHFGAICYPGNKNHIRHT